MKTNKLMALIIAMIMLFSLAVPGFASGRDYESNSTGSDGTEGKGTGIDWVEKKLISVVFPTTVGSAASTFDFIVDSQRTIPSVNTYYSGAVSWSGASGGIYFLISGTAGTTSGEINGNVYSSTSKKLVVTNKSSHSVDIIANAKLPDVSGLTPMAASSGATNSGSPLYLKLAVFSGSSGQSGAIPSGSVSGSAGVFVSQTLNGVADNFKTYDLGNGSYKYDFKPESELSGWESTNIFLEGYVASGVKISGTIPTVNVTWSYNDPSGMTFLGNAGVTENSSGIVESTGVHYVGSLESGKTHYIYSPRLTKVDVGTVSGKAFTKNSYSNFQTITTTNMSSGVTFDSSTHIIKVDTTLGKPEYLQVENSDGDKYFVQFADYTDGGAAHAHWSGGSLWIGKTSSEGFSSSNLRVEVSEDNTTYTTLTSSQFSVNDSNWISTTWDNIEAGMGKSLSTNVYIRVTDGLTRYVLLSP